MLFRSAQPGTVSAQPTIQPTPTYVPTIIPISGAPLAIQISPTAVPTSSFNGQPTSQPGTGGGPPLALTLCILSLCGIFILLISVLVLGFIVRRQNQKRDQND